MKDTLANYGWAPWAGLLAGLLSALAGLGVEKLIKHIPLKVLAGGTIGLVLGLFIAKLIGVGSPPSKTPLSTSSSISFYPAFLDT